MSWLTPLGFLGLIGLIALIIIYIIKPNYQNKIISSTFIWKLSLRYRKKKIPISKLRNIILFICQVLIITLASFILAQPFLANDEAEVQSNKVVIIDASASMLTTTGGSTRFERAVEEVREMADDILDKNGRISIILASDTASFLVQEAGTEARSSIGAALDKLVDPALGLACTYSTPDIEGAIKLSEKVTQLNSDVEVILYTDTTYVDKGEITVKSVSDVSDWNASILDVRAVLDENYYRFEIDTAAYGINADIRVYCTIYGVNDEKSEIDLVADVRCENNEISTIVFANNDDSTEKVEIYSYERVYVHIEEDDSLDLDNAYHLYGGEKLPLRIQYYSALPNNFFSTALMILRDRLAYRWDIEIVEVKGEDVPETEGFDLYIFEHALPVSTLPTDGVVLLANPDEVPSVAGLRLGSILSGRDEVFLEAGDAHPLTKNVVAENISVTQYTRITSADGYTTLLTCQGDPVFMAKNEPDQKIAIMSFSLNYSNLSMLLEFPIMMYNLIEYYIPSTVTEYVFEIGDKVELGSRSEYLGVIGPDIDKEFTEFPAKIELNTPGVYTVTQTPISGEDIVESFYVKIPSAESNINSEEDVLENPFFYEEDNSENKDLLLYFALALVALLFVEWWLQTREQF